LNVAALMRLKSEAISLTVVNESTIIVAAAHFRK
jgi:hypothetical protein